MNMNKKTSRHLLACSWMQNEVVLKRDFTDSIWKDVIMRLGWFSLHSCVFFALSQPILFSFRHYNCVKIRIFFLINLCLPTMALISLLVPNVDVTPFMGWLPMLQYICNEKIIYGKKWESISLLTLSCLLVIDISFHEYMCLI